MKRGGGGIRIRQGTRVFQFAAALLPGINEWLLGNVGDGRGYYTDELHVTDKFLFP